MPDHSEELPVYLRGEGYRPIRVGILARDDAANVQFVVDQNYIDLGPSRPILSVSWHVPGDEDLTTVRLCERRDKLSRFGQLPPWFGNLLPEGALRNLVETQMPTGRVSEFDIIRRLGSDLPGAVVVGDGGGIDASAPSPVLQSDTALPRLRFSLAGVQLKFSSLRQGGRLTLPAQGTTGNVIVKLPHERYPQLPEIEFSSMKLAEAAGVRTASCELLPSSTAEDIPERLRPGPYVLAVTRFDRTDDGGRIHTEDFSQVMEAVGDQKYAKANEESIVNAVRRFAESGAAAIEQAVRRVVINILIGNTDAHLKNWSFIFPAGTSVDLAPAYDIVSIVLLNDDEQMALKLRGTKDPKLMTADRFVKFAQYVGFTDHKMRKVVTDTVARAADTWPDLLKGLPLTRQQSGTLGRRWKALPLPSGYPSPFPG
jgi:serine/threonine-protein kinase HipA